MRTIGRAPSGSEDDRVDLGAEPPLVIGEQDPKAPLRRAVSMRWLTGTILTGVTSIFLMGGALMAALSSTTEFAEIPRANAAVALASNADLDFGRKGDKIAPIHEEVSSRQILQVSTVTKQGERDFIKLRPFAKIEATLSARESEFDGEIPAYDALRIFADTSEPEPPADGGTAVDDEFYGANVDGEVSVKVSDFPVGTSDITAAAAPTVAEVEAIVRASLTAGDGATESAMLAYADAGYEDDFGEEGPFAAVDVSIVPENVSNVAKSAPVVDEGLDEQIVTVEKGKDIDSLLADNGVTDLDRTRIVSALGDLVDLGSIAPGQKLRLAFATDIGESEPVPIRVSIYDNGAHQASVARTDDNTFRRTDPPRTTTAELLDVETEAEAPGAMPRVYTALYRTALEQEVPKPLIDQLIRIFAFDVDFQSRIRPGDAIEVFHSMAIDEPGSPEPEILYASLTLNGVSRKFYRFRTPDDGIVDYYDVEGKSAKKFLMRKPMTAGVLRSGFGMRRHPILGRRRMHTGVDYAAKTGTPILAAGNGVVAKAGRHSGYGNLITIKHTNGYETAYAHQSRFAKGIRSGSRVRQGQIIGYVGSTGLSTGPHLHFEIRVNGKPVDPLRIRLPRRTRPGKRHARLFRTGARTHRQPDRQRERTGGDCVIEIAGSEHDKKARHVAGLFRCLSWPLRRLPFCRHSPAAKAEACRCRR